MKPRNIMTAVVAAFFVVACGGANQNPTQNATTTPGTEVAQAQPASANPSQPPAPAGPATAQAPKPAAPRPASSNPAPPPPPPKPQTIEIPAGTVVEMELIDGISSKTSMAGDTFKAKVIDPILMGGVEVIPMDSIVEGTVTEAISAKQMTGQASLSLAFSKITLPSGNTVEIQASLSEKGKKIGKRTAGIVGGSAAGGAVLGRIIGKDTKGAVVGAVLGAAVGTGVAASQKGQELKLPAGTGMSIELAAPAQVPVPNRTS